MCAKDFVPVRRLLVSAMTKVVCALAVKPTGNVRDCLDLGDLDQQGWDIVASGIIADQMDLGATAAFEVSYED